MDGGGGGAGGRIKLFYYNWYDSSKYPTMTKSNLSTSLDGGKGFNKNFNG